MYKFSKSRLEAFSDGVIAIIITIMVLNIPLPETFGLSEILGLLRSILIFFVSFFIVGSHWNNHHILFERVEKITSKVVWRNLLFLFCLSLMPIFAKWVMENPDASTPAIGYVVIFVLVSASYQLIWSSIIASDEGEHAKEILKLTQRGTRYWWWRWGSMIFFSGALIALSYFFPRFSLIFLIGLPVTLSLFNLVTERERDPRALRRLAATNTRQSEKDS